MPGSDEVPLSVLTYHITVEDYKKEAKEGACDPLT